MTKRLRKLGRRTLAMVMAASMTFSSMSTAVFADTASEECTHHPEHTADCAYAEAVACTHLCTAENGCMVISEDCSHEHDETCTYVEAVEGIACVCVPSEDVSESKNTEWSVKEIDVPAGYRSEVTKVNDNYFIVTNTWVEEKANPSMGA